MAQATTRNRQPQEAQVSFTEQLKRSIELAKCKQDPVYFISNYVYIFEPRIDKRGRFSAGLKLFELWPRQVEYVNFLEQNYRQGKGAVVEKCRDMGATFTTLAWIFWHWLFDQNFTALLGSLTEEDIKKNPGEPDPLFSKIDWFITNLPPWFLPEGFNYDTDSMSMSLVNKKQKNAITGQRRTDRFGLGKRKSVIMIDEYADWEFSVTGNCRYTTNSLIRVSTVKGENHFTRESDAAKETGEQFIFEWWENPYHDQQWYEEEEEADTSGGVDFARFVLRDREASAAGKKVYTGIKKVPVGEYDYNPDWPLFAFADLGLRDEFYIGWGQIDYDSPNKDLYLIDEFVHNEEDIEFYIPFLGVKLYPMPLYTEEQEAILERHQFWKPPLVIFGDPAGNQRNIVTKTSAYDVLRKHGIRPKCDLVLYRDYEQRIKSSREALKRLHVSERCTRFMRSMRLYHFPKDREGSERTTGNTTPVHDEHSHIATAFQFFTITENQLHRAIEAKRREATRVERPKIAASNPWKFKRAG